MLAKFVLFLILLFVLACLLGWVQKRKPKPTPSVIQKDKKRNGWASDTSDSKPLWLTMRDQQLRSRVYAQPSSWSSRPSRIKKRSSLSDDDDSPTMSVSTSSFSGSGSCHTSSHSHSNRDFGGGHCGGGSDSGGSDCSSSCD